MTKSALADPRRARVGGLCSRALDDGQSPSMPILFQLADLSQAIVITPPRAARECGSRPAAERSAGQAFEPSAGDRIRRAETDPTAAKDESSASESASPTATQPAADAELLAAVPSAAAVAAPNAADSPTIRQRAELRKRRQQSAAAGGDWFRTQGRYILVVFAIALLGTIYLARNKDDAPPAPASEPAADRLAEDVSTAGESAAATPDESTSPIAAELDRAGASRVVTAKESAVAESSPDEMVANPASVEEVQASHDAPQVTLQPPLAAAEAPAAPQTDPSLFPWAGREETRTASRPSRGSSSVPLPVENPHYQGGTADATQPSTAADAAFVPAEHSVFPGAAPPAGRSVEPAGSEIHYPVTDPARYRPPPVPAPARGAAPASYQNPVAPNPTTSGPRYERSGSGLY